MFFHAALSTAGQRHESVDTLVEDMDTQIACTPVKETAQPTAKQAEQKDAMQTPVPAQNNPKETPGKTDVTMAVRSPADDAAGPGAAAPTPMKLECRLDSAATSRDWDEASWSKDSWWSEADWKAWGRAWSSTSWQAEWATMPEKAWHVARGWSRELEFEEHAGWKQTGDSDQEHAQRALQRQASTLEDQHRPSAPGDGAAKAQDAPKPEDASNGGDAAAKPGEAQDAAKPEDASNGGDGAANEAQDAAKAEDASNEGDGAANEAQDAAKPEDASNGGNGAAKAPDGADPDAWRKNKKGDFLNPHALYMRFYRSIRRQPLKTANPYGQSRMYSNSFPHSIFF